MKMESCRSNYGEGIAKEIMEEESWRMHHGGATMEEAPEEVTQISPKNHRGTQEGTRGHRGNTQEAPRDTQEAPRRHPGNTQEETQKAPRKHPGLQRLLRERDSNQSQLKSKSGICFVDLTTGFENNIIVQG